MDRIPKAEFCSIDDLLQDEDPTADRKTPKKKKKDGRSPSHTPAVSKYEQLEVDMDCDVTLKRRKSTPSKIKVIRKSLFNKTKNFLQEIRDKHVEYKNMRREGKASILKIVHNYI